MKKVEFIPTIAPMVQAENKKRGNPLYESVVIAQAICESAWGQSTIMMKANAIFGIKATPSWNGKVYNATTRECYDGVNMTDVNACFRAYDKLQDSISDYFDLICKASRYEKALHCSSAEDCITAIKNGGYATDPNYISKILSIIKSNNLKKYDHVETVENRVENPTVPETPTVQPEATPRSVNHTVVQGESLSAIACKYGIEYQNIYIENKTLIDNENIKRGVEPSKMWLYPGQVLKITINVPQNTKTENATYTVVSGDNLSSIASKFGTTYLKIYNDNKTLIDNENIKRGVDPSKMWLYPGQVLTISK